MKALKYVLLVLALAAPIVSSVAVAEETPKAGGKQAKGDRMKDMTEQLGLSEAQVAKIQPIVAEEGKALRALQQDSALAQEDKRGKMREIRQAHAAKIRAVLTPEQQAKFDSMGPGPGGKGKGKGKDKSQR